MTRMALVSVLSAALTAPGLAGAQEYQGEYEQPEEPSDREPAGQIDDPAETARPGTTPSQGDFENGLSPHGEWVESPGHGHVWRPRVPAGWRPYYNGHWTWSNEGWFWASDEPWAWATYHYGRWAFDPALGWVWVPGYDWAPAWVSWRFGAGVVGWAPLFPGFSIHATAYPWFPFAWTFVPRARFVGFPCHRFAFPRSFAPRFFHLTRPAPPRFAWGGHRGPAFGGPPHRFMDHRSGGPPHRFMDHRSGGAPPHRFMDHRSGRSMAPGRPSPGWGRTGQAPAPRGTGWGHGGWGRAMPPGPHAAMPHRPAMPHGPMMGPRAGGFHGGGAPTARSGGAGHVSHGGRR